MEPTTKTLKTKVVPDTSHAPWTLDYIECPKCLTKQSARIFENGPKAVYLHECTGCGFIIEKKDWNSIQ